MAGIDKTHLLYEDYLALKEWCKTQKFEYVNGREGSPMDYLFLYDEPYEGKAPVWNTSEAFDKWLYFNCPLSFIQERLREQYGENCDEYFSRKCEFQSGTRYIRLTRPKHQRYNGNWWVEINDETSRWIYDSRTNMWYDYHKQLIKLDDDQFLIWLNHASIKRMTKRKLNRLIKKWKLPIGTYINISNIYVGSDYSIQIVK